MQAGKLIVKLAINPVELRGKQWYKAGMITSLDQHAYPVVTHTYYI